jgi:DNA-binding protein H-NS
MQEKPPTAISDVPGGMLWLTTSILALIPRSTQMAKINLSSMSVDALLQLREDVGRALSGRAGDLQRQLAALGKDVSGRGRGNARKGIKVAAKYRGPGGETWAGRGAMPRWMTAAIKEGKKRDDFLIDKSAAAAPANRGSAKRGRPRKKK